MVKNPFVNHVNQYALVNLLSVHQVEVQFRVLQDDVLVGVDMLGNEVLWHTDGFHEGFFVGKMMRELATQLAEPVKKLFTATWRLRSLTELLETKQEQFMFVVGAWITDLEHGSTLFVRLVVCVLFHRILTLPWLIRDF